MMKTIKKALGIALAAWTLTGAAPVFFETLPPGFPD